MATPEVTAKRKIQRSIKQVLEARQLPYKLHWNAGAPIGTSRVDCDGVIAGHPVYIEVKAFDPKKRSKLTARQISDLRDYQKAGAWSLVIESEEDLQDFLGWLWKLIPRTGTYPLDRRL